MTGTPIWDNVYEIAALMNLILPMDDQLPKKRGIFLKKFFDKNKLKPEGAMELKNKFRGRISYLRGLMTTAKREEIGVTEPWTKHIIVYPSYMSSFQAKYALEARQTVVKQEYKVRGEIKIREIKGGDVYRSSRDAATLVFPVFGKSKRTGKKTVVGGSSTKIKEGTRMRKIFDVYVELSKRGRYIFREMYKKQLIEQLGPVKGAETIDESLANLRKYSAKMASVIKIIKENPKELVYVYSQFVTGSGGAIIMGLIIQLHGFIWAHSAGGIRTVSNKKRFAILSSLKGTINDPVKTADFRNSFNRSNNKYAERCQVIIGTAKTATGFTLKNVRQVHVVVGEWNLASLEQAEGRVFRAGSHNDLPKDERYINIYRHIAVQDDIKNPDDLIDVLVYRIAEEKEEKNTPIYRLLKEIAFDCAINYERNVLESDNANTRPCDFQYCNYRCDGFPRKNITKRDSDGNPLNVWKYDIPIKDIKTDTYDVYYASADIERLKAQVIELFGNYFVLEMDMLASLLLVETQSEMGLLLRALEFIINDRILIKNRYGFGSYLKEDDNVYFLDNSVSVTPRYSESIYISRPLITEGITLGEVSDLAKLRDDIDRVERFCKAPSENVEELDRLFYQSVSMLVEKAYELKKAKERGKTLTEREEDAVKVLMEKYEKRIIKVYVNAVSIDQLVELLKRRIDKEVLEEFIKKPSNRDIKGTMKSIIRRMTNKEAFIRRALQMKENSKIGKNFTVTEMTIINFVIGEGKDITLDSQLKPIHNILAREAIRAYNEKFDEWEDVEWNPKDYNDFYVKEKVEWEENIGRSGKQYNAYGIIDSSQTILSKQFKIRVKKKPGQRETKGQVCFKSIRVPRLYDLYVELDHFPEASVENLGDYIPKKDSPEDFIKALKKKKKDKLIEMIKSKMRYESPYRRTEFLEKYDQETLVQIYTMTVMSRDDLCRELQEWFKDEGILYKQ